MLEKRLDALLAVVDGIDSLAILTHNNPDPDAIASAVTLQFLLAEKAEGHSIYSKLIGMVLI
jgi:nanoRNase/pAp phosphatase (c-di-AMP/oligoRNAs hydrolase)